MALFNRKTFLDENSIQAFHVDARFNPFKDSWSDAIGGPLGSFLGALGDAWSDTFDFHVNLLEQGFALLGIEDEIIYITGISGQKIIEDLPQSNVDRIVLEHALVNTNLADAFLLDNLTGVLSNVDRYYEYGLSDYVHGIPTATAWYLDLNNTDITSVLDSIEGVPTTLGTVSSNNLDITTWIKWQLQELHSYKFYDNTLPDGGYDYTYNGYSVDGITGEYEIDLTRVETKLTTIYLETTIATVAGTETTTIKEHTTIYLDGVFSSESYSTGTITVQAGDGSNDGFTQVTLSAINETYNVSLVIADIPVVDDTRLFLIVTYAVTTTPTLTKLWVYDRSLGTYPALDNYVAGGIDTSKILPIAILRSNSVDIDDDELSPEYITTTALLDKLGLDPKDYLDALRDNPNSDQIQEAAIVFSMNLYSEVNATRLALHSFFSDIYDTQEIDETAYTGWTGKSNSPVNLFTITEDRFNTLVQYNYIIKTDVVGSIGDVGTCLTFETILPNSPEVDIDEDDQTTGNSYGDEPRSTFTLQYQYNATNYTQIVVHGLVLFTAIITTGGEANVEVLHLEEDVADNKRALFNIPLGLGMIDTLTREDREAVLYDSLHLSIYAKETVYLEFYETAAFTRFLGAIVLIVSIVLNVGSGGTVGTVLWNLFRAFLIQYALTWALTEILSHGLSDAEKAIVIAVYAYLSYQNATGALGGKTLNFAEEFLIAVNSVTPALMIDQSIQMEGLNEEMALFRDLAMDRQEQLDEISDLLSQEGQITAYDLMEIRKDDHYENPTDFYTRTIHTGNPGVLTLDQINEYHNNALKLPELT